MCLFTLHRDHHNTPTVVTGRHWSSREFLTRPVSFSAFVGFENFFKNVSKKLNLGRGPSDHNVKKRLLKQGEDLCENQCVTLTMERLKLSKKSEGTQVFVFCFFFCLFV